MSGQGIWATFTGRLGRDAEFRVVKNGTMPLATLNMAVTLDDSGKVQWVKVACFKALAETARGWLKGEIVSAEGFLKVEEWKAVDGTPRHGLSAIAVKVSKGYRRREQSDQQQAAPAQRSAPAGKAP